MLEFEKTLGSLLFRFSWSSQTMQ